MTSARSSVLMPAARVILFAFACLSVTSVVSAQSMSAPNRGEWWNRSYEFRSKYYAVKSDLPREETIELAQHMDLVFATYAELFRDFGVKKPRPLALCLFADVEDKTNTMVNRFGTDGSTTPGSVRNVKGTSYAFVHNVGGREMKMLLQHEAFHQAAGLFFPKIPQWANEGMAEVFERGIVMDGRFVLGEVSDLDKRWLIKDTADKQFLPFRRLFAITTQEWIEILADENQNCWAMYRQSWCLCHFLLYAADSKYQGSFLQFLALLNQGVSREQAFVRAFGVPRFESLEQNWLRYVDGLTGTSYRQTMHRLEFLAQGMLALHERDIHPTTLAELKTEMQKINFRFTSTKFGKKLTSTAGRNELYTVSMMSKQKPNPKPVFRIVNSDGRPIHPDTPLARRPKTPLTIETHGYFPKEFRVRWERVRGNYHPIFEVD